MKEDVFFVGILVAVIGVGLYLLYRGDIRRIERCKKTCIEADIAAKACTFYCENEKAPFVVMPKDRP